MQYKSTIFFKTTLFISLFLLLGVNSTVEELTMDTFIKHKLYCEGSSTETETQYIKTHYFLMNETIVKKSPPGSLKDVMESANKLLENFQMEVNFKINAFVSDYMNVGTYTGNFMTERFDSFNNLVFTVIETMFKEKSRFKDWKSVDDRTTNVIASNVFTNLIGSQRSLIMEFEKMAQVVKSIQSSISSVTGTPSPDSPKMFTQMKEETIQYLALIFIAAFEHDSNSQFSSQDNILESYWEHFYDWLEVSRCEILVNGAYNGALDKIKDVDQLKAFLKNNQNSSAIDQIKLKQDVNEVKKMSQNLPDLGAKIGSIKNWGFFEIQNLEELMKFSDDNEVNQKVSFDIFRLEDKKHCLQVIKEFKNFLDMKKTYQNKVKYMGALEYYYIIEYLLALINDSSLKAEFPDAHHRKKAIQIIYLFINKIWLEDRAILDKMENFGLRFVHIVTRILIGLDAEEDLRLIIKTNELDEETELYIYKLFIIITESSDLPKGDSDELNKKKGKTIVDDEEEKFKINLPNPRFRKVIDRFFIYAKQSKNAPTWIVRYKKKHFTQDIIGKNKMFEYDIKFFELEQKMAKNFEKSFTFEKEKKEYEALKIKYLKEVKGFSGNEITMTNDAILDLGGYYLLKVSELFKKFKETKVTDKKVVKDGIDKILLEHFGKLKSNMIEKEYYKTLIYVHAKSGKKIPLPDFKYILRTSIKDDDRLDLFEYMKRIISYIKHTKKKNGDQLIDTLDINTNHFDDKSEIRNGERFQTLLLDVVEFFEPELRFIQRKNLENGSSVSYSDIEHIINLIKTSLLDKDEAVSNELENYRLMMKWNLFDDINEYLPLIKNFLNETKSYDPVSSPLKIRLLTENYTNLYLAILEHRLFCAEHQFSFEEGKADRIRNFIRYLEYKNNKYEVMIDQALPAKEVRYSALNVRELQNVIYFVNFRLKQAEFLTDEINIKMSEIYYPYAFREIYLLSSNHPDLSQHINDECSAIYDDLLQEKKQRTADISSSTVLKKHSKDKNFKFCLLIFFNRDMVELVEEQGRINDKLEAHLTTITTEDIFMKLIVPYYDKLSAVDMIIQVFNLNMSHSSAASEMSASTFSSYITLLDYFFQIIDDLKDGRNDSLQVEKLNGVNGNKILVDFCRGINNDGSAEQIKYQMSFIRTILLEKLKPSFYQHSTDLLKIFTELTNGNDKNKRSSFISKLSYGYKNGTFDLSADGHVLDFRLLALLMIYAPHSEFTADVIFERNLIGALPKLISNARDNQSFLYREFTKEKNIDQVYKTCYDWILKDNQKVGITVDKEASNTMNDDGEMDFDMLDNLEDELFNVEDNNMFEKEEVVVEQSDIESNIKEDNSNELILVKVIEKERDMIVNEDELSLNVQPIVNEHIIVKDQSKLSENEKISQKITSEMIKLDQTNNFGIIIADDRSRNVSVDMEGLNVNQTIDSNNKKHISFSRDSETIERQIEDENLNSRITMNSQMVLRFQTTIDGDESNNQALLKKKMEALQKLTEKTMKDMASKKNMTAKITSVKVTSQQMSSQRIQMNTRTSIQESIQEFNEISHSSNFKGANNNTIVYRDSNDIGSKFVSSQKDTKNYINSLLGDSQSSIKNLVQKTIGSLRFKSKSWSGNTTKKDLVKLKPKSSSFSGNSKKKNFRLV